MLKILLLGAAATLGLVLTVLAANTFFADFRSFSWDKQDPYDVDENGFVGKTDAELGTRLARSLTFRTVSVEGQPPDRHQFLGLHRFLRESFPLVHASPSVELTIVNDYSLLYKVKGYGDEDGELPYMLAAHLDVVPVDGNWTAEPFEGGIIDGVVYGRGALDDKSSIMGILEALELMLEKEYKFRRTFYVAFGHDEEISGFQGAGKICQHLKETGVTKLDFVLDEGYFVLEDLVLGVDQLVSVIGVTEKGYLTLELSVEGQAGHSSIPPAESPIGVLAAAVARLEQHPHPSFLERGVETDFFAYLAPHAKLGYRFVFSNLWLLAPLVKVLMRREPASDAMQRTTTAVTVFHGGYKDNVIANRAWALVNHRIHSSDSLERVLEHDRRVVADERVRLRVVNHFPPTPVAPYGERAPPFRLIARTIKQIYPTSIVAPACSPGNTDLRRYVELTGALYRISPTILTPRTKGGLHGDDERIAVSDYRRMIDFYVRLVRNADLPIRPASGHSRHDL